MADLRVARRVTTRYKELPKGTPFGSTSPQQPGLKPGVWQQWGAVILPPLPATATSVTVNIPRGLSDSAGLSSMAIGTITNVPVTLLR